MRNYDVNTAEGKYLALKSIEGQDLWISCQVDNEYNRELRYIGYVDIFLKVKHVDDACVECSYCFPSLSDYDDDVIDTDTEYRLRYELTHSFTRIELSSIELFTPIDLYTTDELVDYLVNLDEGDFIE